MSSETETIEFERSSGNVFADLALSNATEELAKADFAIEITRRIRARGLTQTEAATLLGTAQSKISAIRRGCLTYFTYDRLLRFLNLLGCNVEIVVTPADEAELRGHTVASIKAQCEKVKKTPTSARKRLAATTTPAENV